MDLTKIQQAASIYKLTTAIAALPPTEIASANVLYDQIQEVMGV